ncbi:MAG: globin domain-containing protein [Byssovorax sp.]
MLSDEEKKHIRDSWRLVVPIKETAADLFYRRLFELKPEYRSLFQSDMSAQKRKLVTMLSFIVKSLDWKETAWRDDVSEADDLFLVVLAMGRRHSSLYKIPDEAYAAVGASLIWALEQGLGEAFTPDTQQAWARVYDLVSRTMLLGSAALDMGAAVVAPEGDES